MMSCRDNARLGQLLINRGLWPTTVVDSNKLVVEQLVKPELADQVTKQQIPHVSKAYGLLTWLGGAKADPDGVQCCAPRWGGKKTCTGKTLRSTIIGDDVDFDRTTNQSNGDILATLPENVGVAMGWLGQCVNNAM